MTVAFEPLMPERWLENHSAASEEGRAKEPLRNWLSISLDRPQSASQAGQISLVR
jgi:hypothetical protein